MMELEEDPCPCWALQTDFDGVRVGKEHPLGCQVAVGPGEIGKHSVVERHQECQVVLEHLDTQASAPEAAFP